MFARGDLKRHLRIVRRLAAIVVLGALVTTTVASAATAGCPTMRARALKHCCCPPSASDGARLTCCSPNEDVRASASSPREQSERVQMTPPAIAPGFLLGADQMLRSIVTAAPSLVASAAGPPPTPLRV